MLFQVYGENALYQWLGLLLVFGALILVNELTRRSKIGGILFLFAIPAVLTGYFIAIYIGAANGAEWALNNPTYIYMNSWFHYAKLYAALAGCIGFMMIRYRWGVGKKRWFLYFPWFILAANILIAVVSDLESAFNGWQTWWTSSEGVALYGGWHNVMNAAAGVLNIVGITGWLGIKVSKDKRDMLWPDMSLLYIIAYDIWNFAYTYNCLPTHAWYCGVALLLAPTVAALFWNKGAWLANRAHTLAIWCMFAQVFPMFQDYSVFSVRSVQYAENFVPMTVISALALIANIVLVAVVFMRAKKLKKNPYMNDVFADTAEYKEIMARADMAVKAVK